MHLRWPRHRMSRCRGDATPTVSVSSVALLPLLPIQILALTSKSVTFSASTDTIGICRRIELIRMTRRTFGNGNIQNAVIAAATSKIFRYGYWLKVRYFDAATNTTEMVDSHPDWNRSYFPFVVKSVGQPQFTVIIKPPISLG